MTIQEIVKVLPLKVISGQSNLEKEVNGGYVSDLLSNVMGQAHVGNLWVTMQGHQNIVAVALLAGLTGIIIAGGVEPEPEAVRKAAAEEIVILTTNLSAYEIVGRLYQLGVTGE